MMSDPMTRKATKKNPPVSDKQIVARYKCCGQECNGIPHACSLVDKISSLETSLREAQEKLKSADNALEKINNLDAEKDSDEGYNERGLADCFVQAQVIAKKALAKIRETKAGGEE